jgi:hypothetical protein
MSQIRRYAMSLPEVTEEPHFKFSSFRVRGKIFVTVPPDEEFIHVFVSEEQRALALALEPDLVEKLHWGKSVVGLRVRLASAKPAFVNQLIHQAWSCRAPKKLRSPERQP